MAQTKKLFIEISSGSYVNRTDVGGVRILDNFKQNLKWEIFSIHTQKWINGGRVDQEQFLEIIESLGFTKATTIYFRDASHLHCIQPHHVIRFKDHLHGPDMLQESISIKTAYDEKYICISDPSANEHGSVQFALDIKPFVQTSIGDIAKILKS